jgi:hypothetical protein
LEKWRKSQSQLLRAMAMSWHFFEKAQEASADPRFFFFL